MKWKGVRQPFCLDRVWSSRLLWPMYPFMHAMNDILCTWNTLTKLSHISLFMSVSSSFEKNSDLSCNKKIFWFGLKKIRFVFVYVKKKKSFWWRKITRSVLLSKTKSSGSKMSDLFWELKKKKLVFGLYVKKSYLFCNKKFRFA